MDILKQLKINGNQEVNAVLVKDGTEEYPVFLQSLTNTVMLDTLLAEGWQLCGLPCDLRKDGVKLTSLPVEEFNATTVEEQDMWDLIGEPLPLDQLKARLTEATVEYLEVPERDIKIHTREEFLGFLEESSQVEDDNDFLPINYFVDSNALFTVEEFTSVENNKYLVMLEERRKMTYNKFKKLRAWLHSKGLKEDFTPIDVMDAYFQWGIDGLNMPLISKKRDKRSFTLGTGDVSFEMKRNQYVYKTEMALVTNTGELLLPEHSKSIKWSPFMDQKDFSMKYQQLQNGETALVDLKSQSVADVTILDGAKAQVIYDSSTVMVDKLKFGGIRVYPFTEIGAPLSQDLWNPKNMDRQKEICFLKAISRYALSKCKMPVDVSSIKALTLSGCSPLSALTFYIASTDLVSGKTDRATGASLAKEDGMPVITYTDVQAFCAGVELAEEKQDTLYNFLHGITSMGAIADGIQAEEEYSADTMYRQLYVIHFCLGVSLDDIYETLTKSVDEEKIKFSNGEYDYYMDLPKLTIKKRAYNADMTLYRDMAIEESNYLVYVTQIAREMGDASARRAVAFEGLFVEKTAPVKALLKQIKDLYVAELESKFQDPDEIDRRMSVADIFSTSRYFEAAMKGTITFPTSIGGRTISLSSQESYNFTKYMKSKIESTMNYCDMNSQVGKFMYYCVNAYISPEYIIPKTSFKIKETNFAMLWRDLPPQTRAVAIDKGYISENHSAWDNRYMTDRLYSCDLESIEALCYYDEIAKKYITDISEYQEIGTCPHPLEYMYPALFDNDEDNVRTSENKLRDGKAKYVVGETKMVSQSDFEDILSIDGVAEDELRGIKSFVDFSAEDYYLVNDLINKEIKKGEKGIIVDNPERIWTQEHGFQNYAVIANLGPEYGIFNVQGRHYVFRDVRGKLHEATI